MRIGVWLRRTSIRLVVSRVRRLLISVMIASLFVLLQSCSPAVLQGIGQAASDAASASGGSTVKLMIFGGPDHKTYLGCLTCSQYSTGSVLNQYGEYGSRYSTDSIWNRYGDFGSPYSSNSACNAYTTDSPVIVDENGNAYGRLTLNLYDPHIALGQKFVSWLRDSVCANN